MNLPADTGNVKKKKKPQKGGKKMWIVRFVRKDKKPDEEYFYHTQSEAEYHRSLFDNDDSGLYEKIEVVDDEE